jgi:hypothetical protein
MVKSVIPGQVGGIHRMPRSERRNANLIYNHSSPRQAAND